jgi:hypothetical protein
VKAKTNFVKGDFDWMIEFAVATKVTTIPAFDLPMKLHFLLKNTIRSFSHYMMQPFVTTTITFVVIKVHGEIDNKFELLIIDESSPKDIQIVSFLNSRF